MAWVEAMTKWLLGIGWLPDTALNRQEVLPKVSSAWRRGQLPKKPPALFATSVPPSGLDGSPRTC
jgi:hypothetical protein